ncbi:MAG: CRTAC1 family protein [Planctomycetales bacterium]|nr:CRTAC1 family protein [Planctomycetales bacterium]
MSGRVVQRQQAINESQALAFRIGSGNAVDPRLGGEIGRVLNSIGRPIESLAWQETLYEMTDPTAPQLAILRQHKSKVLQQWPDGINEALILCGIDADQFASVETDLATLRSSQPIPADLRDSPLMAIDTEPLVPVFTDVAKSVGIQMRHVNAVKPVEKEFRLFEALGSGVAVLDFDRDGMVDLYLGQAGSEPPSGTSNHSNRLMRGTGDRFVDVTTASGSTDLGYTHGVTAGDWNQDGLEDLVIGNVGSNRLLINQGDGTFRAASHDSGELPDNFDEPTVTTSVALADLNGDSLPDLFEANYVDDPRVYDPIRYDANGKPIVLPGPKHFTAAQPRMFITSADGHLIPETIGPKEVIASTGLGLLVSDFEGDGRNEVFVANDQNPNQLWKLTEGDSGRTWTNLAVVRGCAFGTGGKPFACMGIAAADFDSNGTLDLHVTNFNGECSNLFLQNRSGVFVDRAVAYRMDEPTVAMVGFGTQSIDYDNNGTIDLVIANGHIEDFRSTGKPFRMPTQILAHHGDRFVSMNVQGDSKYWSTSHLGRGVATLDWNRDGRVDVAVTDLMDDFVLLENRTKDTGHYLQLELVGSESERDAIGARVTVHCPNQSFYAVVQTGDGYLCRNEPVLNFGLGNTPTIDRITVAWPGGETSEINDLTVDQRVLVIENHPGHWKR